jgi:hypothetical protein
MISFGMPKHGCWLSDCDEEASSREMGDAAKGVQSYTGNLRDGDEVAPKLITMTVRGEFLRRLCLATMLLEA